MSVGVPGALLRLAFLLFPLLCALLPALAAAASFDCAKAGAPVERLVCKSAALGTLDEELAAAYKAAFEASADKDPLVTDQSRWLRLRDRCRNEACVQEAYRNRLGVLRAWHEDAAANAPVYGRYQLTRGNAVYNPDTKDWDPTRSTDCMTLEPDRPGTVRFAINLVQINGHSCWLDGRMKREGASLTYLPDPKEPELKDCRFSMRLKRNTIELSDPDGACRRYACGARASIERTAFLRTARDKGICRL